MFTLPIIIFVLIQCAALSAFAAKWVLNIVLYQVNKLIGTHKIDADWLIDIEFKGFMVYFVVAYVLYLIISFGLLWLVDFTIKHYFHG